MPPKNFLTYVLFLIVKAGHPAIMLYCLYFIGGGYINEFRCMHDFVAHPGRPNLHKLLFPWAQTRHQLALWGSRGEMAVQKQ